MKKLLVACVLFFAIVVFTAIALWKAHEANRVTSGFTAIDVRHLGPIVLGEETGKVHVYALAVRASGHIDGEAVISLMLNGEPYKVEQLQGDIEFEWHGDWYSETAEIRYEPANVKGGTLLLHYKFFH